MRQTILVMEHGDWYEDAKTYLKFTIDYNEKSKLFAVKTTTRLFEICWGGMTLEKVKTYIGNVLEDKNLSWKDFSTRVYGDKLWKLIGINEEDLV